MTETANPTRYIDPTTDYGFRHVFAEESNKNLLMDFLNGIFGDGTAIKDLVHENSEPSRDFEGPGAGVFDIVCTEENGEKMAVNMQLGLHGNLRGRMIWHGCRLFAEQYENGGAGIVRGIVLLGGDATMSPTGHAPEFLHKLYFGDRETGDVFDDGLGFICIELDKFKKGEDDLETSLDCWLYALKNRPKMDRPPALLQKPIFEKLFGVAEYDSLNGEEREMYGKSLKKKRETEASIGNART